MTACSCRCGCKNTNADAGMFTDVTAATLAAMGGEVEHPSEYEPQGAAICENCWPGGRRCSHTLRRTWLKNPYPRFGLRPAWEWTRFAPMEEEDSMPF